MRARTHLASFLTALALLLGAVALAQAQSDEPVFEVEAFDQGLAPLDAPHALETPQAAMEFLLSSADSEDFRRGAHVLNLNHLSEKQQKLLGPQLARKLVYLLESQNLIDWDRLPDLQDARVVPVRETVDQKISAPFPRRSIRLGTIGLGGRPVPILLQRFEVPSGERIWAFSPFTVDHIDRLYDEHGPGLLERHLPDYSKWGGYGAIALWEWAVLAALMGGAVLLQAIIHRVLRFFVRLANRDWAEAAFDCCQRPLSWLLAACALLAAAKFLLPLDGTLTSHIDVVLVALIFLLATWATSRIATAVTTTLARRGPAADPDGEQLARTYQTNIAVMRRVVLFLAAIVGVGVILSYLDIFNSIGVSLLASTGAFAVLLGLAARPVLTGLVESVQIALTKPIEIGDVIEIDGNWGRIEDIRFMYSVLRDWTQKRIIIPHTHLLTTPFENWSKKDMTVSRIIELPVDLGTDLDALREFFLGLMKDDPRWADSEREINVAEITSDSIRVWVWVTARNATDSWYLAADVREALIKWLQQQGGRFLPHERHFVSRDGPHSAAQADGGTAEGQDPDGQDAGEEDAGEEDSGDEETGDEETGDEDTGDEEAVTEERRRRAAAGRA